MRKNVTVDNCCKCSADLKYLSEIRRVNFKWYCDKCYGKYIRGEQKMSESSNFEYWLWKHKNRLMNRLFRKYIRRADKNEL